MLFLRTCVWQHVTFVIILPSSCKHQDSCTPTIFHSFYRLQDDLFIGFVSYISTKNIFLTANVELYLCHMLHFRWAKLWSHLDTSFACNCNETVPSFDTGFQSYLPKVYLFWSCCQLDSIAIFLLTNFQEPVHSAFEPQKQVFAI